MLLVIDTCGAVGGVGLGEVETAEISPGRNSSPCPAQARVFHRELAGKTYSELLLSSIKGVLGDAGIGRQQIEGIVVVHGPGSFTGIRIGVSAAKGLAEGLGVPVLALSRLELLARKAPQADAAAVLDAGRGEFFAGFYRGGVREAELLLTRDLLPGAIAESGLPVTVCEPQVFAALSRLNPELVEAPTVVDAFRVGADRFRAGCFDDMATLDANYLRRSESEMLARIAEHAARRATARAAAPS